MNLLRCTGKDNSETLFQYKFQTIPHENPEEIEFTVIPIDDGYNDFFNFILSIVNDHHLKITMMTANSQVDYSAKGIPEALIYEATTLFKRTIISSSNRSGTGEYRTNSATKVWERLKATNLATYNDSEDRYTYTSNLGLGQIDVGYKNYENDQMEFLQQYINMPVSEMRQIQPLWDDNYDLEQYEIINTSFDRLLKNVNFWV